MQADLLLRLGALQMKNLSFADWQKNSTIPCGDKNCLEWIMHVVGEEFKSESDRVWF